MATARKPSSRRAAPKAQPSLEVVLDAILDGKLDDHFDRIYDALKNRQRTVDQKRGAALEVGRRVRFNDRTRPAYLRGVEGVVVGFKGDKVEVAPDEGVGRFTGGPIRTPVALIEAL